MSLVPPLSKGRLGGVKMTKIFNKASEKAKRQKLRTDMPQAERILWGHLKNKSILDVKFRRQYSVGPYIVDFYCPQLKLAIEIDGDSHFETGSAKQDKNRQAYIQSFGIRFLRFTNLEIYHNLENVLKTIETTIKTSPNPSLSRRGDKFLTPKHCSCRGAVPRFDFERQCREIVMAGLDLGKIEAFKVDDPRRKQCLVHWMPRCAFGLNAQIIYAHEADFFLC